MKRTILILTALLLVFAAASAPQAATAQSTSPWQVTYYNNSNWAGSPIYTEYANAISFNWGSDVPPVPGMPSQNWT